jgi:hypothetical protein
LTISIPTFFKNNVTTDDTKIDNTISYNCYGISNIISIEQNENCIWIDTTPLKLKNSRVPGPIDYEYKILIRDYKIETKCYDNKSTYVDLSNFLKIKSTIDIFIGPNWYRITDNCQSKFLKKEYYGTSYFNKKSNTIYLEVSTH